MLYADESGVHIDQREVKSGVHINPGGSKAL